jgi:Mrp family chromosome partitioning ATPase
MLEALKRIERKTSTPVEREAPWAAPDEPAAPAPQDAAARRGTVPGFDSVADSRILPPEPMVGQCEPPVGPPEPMVAQFEAQGGPDSSAIGVPQAQEALAQPLAAPEIAVALSEPAVGQFEPEAPAARGTPREETPSAAEADESAYAELAKEVLWRWNPARAAAWAFTSPSDGGGTTDVLSRLAPELARRADGEVLIVDANFFHPGLTARLGDAGGRGLDDVLSDAAAWPDAVRPTGVPGLRLLCGRRTGGVKHASEPPSLERLLPRLLEHYRLVLLDTASLAHRGVARLGALCDGTFLVVRLGQTTPRLVRQSARVLDRAGARLLGTIAVQ